MMLMVLPKLGNGVAVARADSCSNIGTKQRTGRRVETELSQPTKPCNLAVNINPAQQVFLPDLSAVPRKLQPPTQELPSGYLAQVRCPGYSQLQHQLTTH